MLTRPHSQRRTFKFTAVGERPGQVAHHRASPTRVPGCPKLGRQRPHSQLRRLRFWDLGAVSFGCAGKWDRGVTATNGVTGISKSALILPVGSAATTASGSSKKRPRPMSCPVMSQHVPLPALVGSREFPGVVPSPWLPRNGCGPPPAGRSIVRCLLCCGTGRRARLQFGGTSSKYSRKV